MLIVGNQKTYLNKEEALDFIKKTSSVDCSKVVICPSYIYIDLYKEKSRYIVGAQNVSEKGNGATTGEISASQLASLGVDFSIVGHSERRDEQKEISENIYNKIVRLLENGIKPIFCIGEHLEDRKSGSTKDFIGKQILEVFDRLDSNMLTNIVIAYEPIWAIGTGVTPTNDEIIDTVQYIKDLVNDKYGIEILVLYGGSVSKKNIDDLNEMSIVDGYLIGSASTKPDDFLYIMSTNK